MVHLEFLPVRNLGYALKSIFTGEEKSGKKGVSPFASLTTELAATIGTGNIVGVAGAMLLGGPGALFWMLAASVFGLATKLVESALSVKYRCKNEKGQWVGGPMYTLQKFAFCNLGKGLGICYAILAVLASLGMGNMVQANSIATVLWNTYQIPVAKVGLVITLLTIFVIIGGINKITKVTQLLVPIMGIFYLAGTLGVIFLNWNKIPECVYMLFQCAFSRRAVGGAAVGCSVLQAMRYGVSRGVFSNEAGLGAAGITAAATDTKDYIKQGYVSMTGVFFDTMIICSITGIAYLCSGVLQTTSNVAESGNGVAVAVAMFEQMYGNMGICFLCISLSLFAFATIIAWAYQGERAFEYLVGNANYNLLYRFMYSMMVFVGAICSLELVWDFSDICNGLLVVPNMICIFLFGLGKNGICREIKKRGKG